MRYLEAIGVMLVLIIIYNTIEIAAGWEPIPAAQSITFSAFQWVSAFYVLQRVIKGEPWYSRSRL